MTVAQKQMIKTIQNLARKRGIPDSVLNMAPVGKGKHGPIYKGVKGADAENLLIAKKQGEVIGAYDYKGTPVDLIWGKEGTGKSDGYGLSKIEKYHPEVLGKIQKMLDTIPEKSRTKNRIRLENDSGTISIRLDWEGESKHWILTAFEK